jgi:hypothetical protein
MQKTSPSAPLRVLTAHNVFDPAFNFDFLIKKAAHELNLSLAAHELNLSLAEGRNIFYWHAMNFSVSIHAIGDYLWWVKAIDDAQWSKNQPNFTNWVITENDCIGAFLDISNTYKHSERRPTQQNKITEHLKLYSDDEVIKNSNPPDELELRNCIRDKTDSVYWPVITTKQKRFIYYRYAAQSALDWWCQYERASI